MFSNVVFAIGKLICDLANTQWAIVLGRVVAGIGGGGFTAISTFVTSDLFPLTNSDSNREDGRRILFLFSFGEAALLIIGRSLLVTQS